MKIKEIGLTQIIHPQSSAKFKSLPHGKTTTICIGDTIDLNLELSGSGPWTISYEIQSDSKQSHTLNSADSISTISHSFEKSGTYVFDLTDITDGNGCSWRCDAKSIQVHVLASRPSISFSGSNIEQFLKGGVARLPVSTSGRYN